MIILYSSAVKTAASSESHRRYDLAGSDALYLRRRERRMRALCTTARSGETLTPRSFPNTAAESSVWIRRLYLLAQAEGVAAPLIKRPVLVLPRIDAFPLTFKCQIYSVSTSFGMYYLFFRRIGLLLLEPIHLEVWRVVCSELLFCIPLLWCVVISVTVTFLSDLNIWNNKLVYRST